MGKDETANEISGGIFFSAVIQGRDITVQLPPEVPTALSGLPAASPSFTGRDAALCALLGALAPRRINRDLSGTADTASAVLVTVVGGLAGVGKTELAVQAARAALAGGWFPGGVLFIDMFGYDRDRRLAPGQVLEGFLRALGIPGEHIPPDPQDRARLYSSVLSRFVQEERRILVVVDNASTHEQVKPLLPADGITGAIVTSRHTLGMLKAHLLDLDVLTPEAAAEMLDRTLKVARSKDLRVTEHFDDAIRIANLCGGLPLALQIIGALLIEDPSRPLAAMAADLQDGRTRLDELRYADVAVRAAFDLSYQRLDPGHARLFRLLPVNPGPDISIRSAAVLAEAEELVTRHRLEALARAHLIERGTIYGRWRMHDPAGLRPSPTSHASTNCRTKACSRRDLRSGRRPPRPATPMHDDRWLNARCCWSGALCGCAVEQAICHITSNLTRSSRLRRP